jgi:predicted dinucleotide-binding enzyme
MRGNAMNKISTIIVSAFFAGWSLISLADEPVTVAIIGTGDMGDSLGPKLSEAGYRIIYGSRDPSRSTLQKLVAETGNQAKATTQKEAAQQATIVLLAIPWPAMEQVAQNLGNLDGKVVIDISTPYQQAADGYMESIVETSSAEMIQQWNPGARVVKTILAGSGIIDDPNILGDTISTHVAADDREAKEIVAKMIAELGLDPVDAGPLRLSSAIEAQALLYITPYLQLRSVGYEMVLRRANFWTCVFPYPWGREPVVDAGNLAEFPQPERSLPPCSTYLKNE